MSQKIQQGLRDWVEARKRFRLSDAHVQMARELGMNPKKLGSIDNHHQEPWKQPLPRFIERLYAERFGRERPQAVMSIEQWARVQEANKLARKEAKRQARAARDAGAPDGLHAAAADNVSAGAAAAEAAV